MAGRVLVLGLDPGFAAIGWSLVALTPTTESVLGMGVVRTTKGRKQVKVLASDDNVRRARELARELRKILLWGTGAQVICAESMSFPRNAGNSAKVCMGWGVLSCLAEERNLPIVQDSPQKIKKKVCGKNDASKEEVRDALIARYGLDPLPMSQLGDLVPLLHGVPESFHEHGWDSLSAVVSCLDSDVIMLARQMVS